MLNLVQSAFGKENSTSRSEKHTWLLSYKCTQETRLRVPEWKILHNIHPTNILLSKMKVRDNSKSSYFTDTVDVIDLFLLNVRLYLNFGN